LTSEVKMKIEKAYAVYFSPTYTTQKSVTAFVKGMGFPMEEIDLTLPKTRRDFKRVFGKNEIVAVGLPVYGGRLPLDLEDFFSGLRGDGTPAVAIVLYGNREFDDALIELRMRLEERGFAVKAGAAFIGEHTFSVKIATGRPDAKDLAIAADFGKKVAAFIRKEASGTLILKGNYPFVKKGYDPKVHLEFPPHPRFTTTDDCNQCGLCSDDCPWAAIDSNDCRIRDYSKCMICYRCFKNCPVEAIQMTNEKFREYLPSFEKRLNAQRKEPELFLPEE
jgi:ferredoxin